MDREKGMQQSWFRWRSLASSRNQLSRHEYIRGTQRRNRPAPCSPSHSPGVKNKYVSCGYVPPQRDCSSSSREQSWSNVVLVCVTEIACPRHSGQERRDAWPQPSWPRVTSSLVFDRLSVIPHSRWVRLPQRARYQPGISFPKGLSTICCPSRTSAKLSRFFGQHGKYTGSTPLGSSCR